MKRYICKCEKCKHEFMYTKNDIKYHGYDNFAYLLCDLCKTINTPGLFDRLRYLFK